MNIFDPLISGSLSVSGSGEISGDLTVLGTIRGTISGTTDNAISASEAPKYTLTSSFHTFTSSYTTGSFTGSFGGDGSGLYNIPASGVTGLNLTRIADGIATASISSANGLRVNSNTEITGALKLNKVELGGNNIVDITLTDGGGKYYINGVKNPKLSFIKGFKYRFYFNNNNVHPILFSLTNDGEHNGGTIYSTGISTNLDPFYVEVDVTDATATTFYYFCDFHVGMGNSITVYPDFLHGQSNINLTNVDTSMFATTGSNNFTNIQRTSGSLVVTGSVDVTGSVNITGSISLNGQAIGTGKLDETTFQSYTSSNDNRISSIETSTGSLNGFTSSIDTTIKNKLNSDNVISGSIQVDITGTTGYSTFSSSISTSIDSLSSSLSSSVGYLSSSVATTTSGLSSSIGSISSSFSSLNDTQNNKLTDIEVSTSSLNSFTSSINTTIKNKLDTESVISGSLQVLITGTTGYSTFSSSISTSISASVNQLSSSVNTTINGLSSSVNTTINGLSSSVATTTSGLSSSIGSLSSSVATTTLGLSSSVSTTTSELSSSIGSLSSSVATTTNGLSSSVGSLSSSVATTTNGLSSSIGSLSSSISTTNLNQNNRLDTIEGKTGSYATTGSNIFQGNQTITGSLYVSQNLIVQGESSLENITASAVSIGTNTIILNTDSPAFRYAGISVFDSGSTNITSSLFYDSLTNQWKFKHTDTGTNDASIMLFGPLGDNIDNAPLLDGNYLTKVENNGHGHHLTTSSIFDNGSKVSINSNTEVTGTLKVTGNINSPNITAIETSTGSLNTFTSSLLTAIELTGSNLTVRGDFLVKGTTTNVNTATLDVDNNLINLNGSGASFAGLRVKDTTGPNLISGSLLWDSANDYWVAGQLGSEQRLVRETEFNNAVTRIGNVETSTGSLNSFTSSINTTIKNKLDADTVVSRSIQVDHNATTNYVANRHIDHTAVSITTAVGSGLSGGGDITTTRDLSIATGGVTNTMLAGSIANNKLSNSSLTIGTTAISLGGSSTTLGGLTSVTSTAFTGSLQGNISGNAATVTTNANLTGIVTSTGNTTTIPNGNITNVMLANSSFFVGTTSISLGRTSASQTLNGVAIDGNAGTVTNGVYLNTDQTITGLKTLQQQSDGIAVILDSTSATHATRFRYRKNGTDYWSLDARGSGESDALNLYRYYSGNWYQVVSWNHSNGAATFSGAVSSSNLSGTNTGDETTARINALAITTVGTITSGTWNGSSISTTYTDAKVTSVTGTANQVIASSTTGAITLSLPQNIHTTATPTFGGLVLSGTGTGNSPTLRINNSTAISFNHSIEAFSANMTAGQTNLIVVGQTGTTKNAGYLGYNWSSSGSNSNYVSLGHWGADNLLRVYGDGTVYMGTVTTGTWQGSSISTTYTAAKVTAVNAGTGVGVDTTTGSVTVSIGQSVATSAVPTFKAAILTSDTDSRVLKLRELGSTSGNIIQFQDSAGNNKWEVVGRSNTDATPFYIYKNDGTNTGYIFSISGSGIPNFHTALTIGGSTAKSISNSSYSTSFSSVTSVTVTHSLGTKDVAVFVYDSSDNMFWPSSIVTTSTSVVTITFSSSRSGRVVVVR
jgi:hypothetical protein